MSHINETHPTPMVCFRADCTWKCVLRHGTIFTHTSKSHVTHQRVMSHIYLSCHKSTSHVTLRTDCTAECALRCYRESMSHVTLFWVMARIYESYYTSSSHVTHQWCAFAQIVLDSVKRHGIRVYFKSMSHVTYHWVTWHTSTSHATICMRDRTGEGVVWGMVVHVMSHLWVMSHITESCHINPRVMSHIHESWHTMYDRLYWRVWNRASMSHVTYQSE